MNYRHVAIEEDRGHLGGIWILIDNQIYNGGIVNQTN